jgi:hypothetical protein
MNSISDPFRHLHGMLRTRGLIYTSLTLGYVPLPTVAFAHLPNGTTATLRPIDGPMSVAQELLPEVKLDQKLFEDFRRCPSRLSMYRTSSSPSHLIRLPFPGRQITVQKHRMSLGVLGELHQRNHGRDPTLEYSLQTVVPWVSRGAFCWEEAGDTCRLTAFILPSTNRLLSVTLVRMSRQDYGVLFPRQRHEAGDTALRRLCE